MKFSKDHAYIVHSTKFGAWYVVRQTSQRTWVATQFSHLGDLMAVRAIVGNGIKVSDDLGVDDYRSYLENKESQVKFRHDMQRVLMYGYFKED